MAAAPGSREIKVVSVPLPPPPKAGDKVLHEGKTQTIQYVLISHGELSLQFHGRPGLVPASAVRPA